MGEVLKRTWRVLLLVGAILTATPFLAAAQGASGSASGTPWLFLGGRVGVEYQSQTPADFNASIQKLYPGSTTYFPVYSTIGISLTERIPIGNAGYSVTVNQLVEASGLDQNFFLPSGTLLLGIHMPFGLQTALGPRIEPFSDGGTVKVMPSLVFTAGWRFELGKASIPVDIVVDPLPPGRHLKVALVTGIDFGIAPHSSKPSQPFNY